VTMCNIEHATSLFETSSLQISVAPEVDDSSELISKVPPTVGVGVEGAIDLDNSDKHLRYLASNTSQIGSAEVALSQPRSHC